MIGLVLVTFTDLFVPVFSGVVLVRIILSYILTPGGRFMELLLSLTEPVLAPVRRVLPPMAGLDLSPLVVVLGLQGLQVLIHALTGL